MKHLILSAALLPALFAMPAAAANIDRMVTDELTKTECSACHIAFPARLLPAASWEALMGDLSNHFGEDASLAPADAEAIKAYLVANAGKPRNEALTPEGTPILRISEMPWFVGEHRGEVSKKAMARAGTMSNCTACHAGAEQGQFDDD